jgi:ABC-type uncharacterized transport system substrate-binding protein
MLYSPNNPSTASYRPAFEPFARQLSIDPITVPVHGLGEIDRALAGLAEQRNTGIFVPPDITINALREEFVALVAQRSLPAIYPQPVFVRSGGLVFYGANANEEHGTMWKVGDVEPVRVMGAEGYPYGFIAN